MNPNLHQVTLNIRPARQFLLLVVATVLLVLTGMGTYRLSEQAGVAALSSQAQHRLDLFAAAVDSIVNRYAHVPGTLHLNPKVAALLRHPEDPGLQGEVNRYLEQLNIHIDSIALMVLDARGQVLASSNWNRDDSFIGEDLSFRPYFQQALQGRPTRYYAIGTTRGDPGYYVSHPIMDGEWVRGVAVIKIGLRPLEEAWLPPETPALIADSNGVVILASLPEWRLTALAPLSQATQEEIRSSRQYNQHPIGLFPVSLAQGLDTTQIVSFPGHGINNGGLRRSKEFVAQSRRLPDSGWRLTVFSDLQPVRGQAAGDATLAVMATAFMLLLLLFINQRRRALRQRLETQELLERANAELEEKVAARTTDLQATNARLQDEVQERKKAEETLRAAQDELVQAAKLAVLGQLATGITHDLTQPLGALRTLSDNAVEFMHRGELPTVEKNLGIIGKLVDRMGSIIEPLKSFARKAPPHPQVVDVGQALGHALFLLERKLRQGGVRVHNRCPASLWRVWCEPVRLEQVLVNLIGNAIDAMAGQSTRELILEAGPAASGRLAIRVQDTGPGLNPSHAERLFEPFFTTKPAGQGLGLGLAISRDIIHDFGGDLAARSRPEGGAEFCIELPLPPEEPCT